MKIGGGKMWAGAAVLLTFSLLCGAPCTWARPAQLAAVPGEKRPEDVAAIRAHLDKIFQGFIHQDGAALRAGHSTDWRGFLEGSRHVGKGIETYMQAVSWALKSPVHLTGYKIVEFEVMFYGDVAVVPYVCEVEGGGEGQHFQRKLRILDVFAKLNGDWIQVATDTTAHPEQMEKEISAAGDLSPDERKSLLEAREAVWRNWFANNAAALGEALPAETIAIEPGSDAFKKRDEILAGAKGFAESGAKLVRLEFPETEIQVYGRTAIVYSKFVLVTELNGKQQERSGRATEMFVLRGDKWVNPGWHLDAGK
ncbi:MAG TPA: nuclear transport factor 2 family protein [Candidatus Acidoferrales bacterium]|nr:nuclear transport factor 2 family protein [Candidatus Acidoferrales bacterium]